MALATCSKTLPVSRSLNTSKLTSAIMITNQETYPKIPGRLKYSFIWVDKNCAWRSELHLGTEIKRELTPISIHRTSAMLFDHVHDHKRHGILDNLPWVSWNMHDFLPSKYAKGCQSGPSFGYQNCVPGNQFNTHCFILPVIWHLSSIDGG